jgi:hypothetical protein
MSYRDHPSLRKPTIPEVYAEMTRAERCLFYLGFLNAAAFFVAFQVIGGGAANGFIRNGHYFLGNHHRYTEVSAAVYHYSQVHTATFFITCLLAVFASASARHRLR